MAANRGARGSILFFDPKQLLDSGKSGNFAKTNSIAEGDEEDSPDSSPKSQASRQALPGAAATPKKKAGGEKNADFIKVAIRIRPMLAKDKGQDDVVKLHMDGQSVSVEHPTVKNRVYTFDTIFDSRSKKQHQLGFASQEDVFQALGSRVVDSALNGYNSCLFAYGQTGTGKTHTVLGGAVLTSQTSEDRGLLPRILENMFSDMEKKKADKGTYGEAEFQVKISYLEIYNESIHDLLVPPKLAKDRALQVKYHPKLGVVVNDLTESVANTIGEANEMVNFGTKMRSVAATSMNSRSSRAHTLFTFRFEQNMPNGDSIISQVQLVDLAGREQERTSGDDPERLRERSFINKSLFHLSSCISNLCKAKSKDKLPEWAFRNSKLTLLLSHSLGGNSRTAMVAAVSPSAADAEETQSTLRFAGAVKSIKTAVSCNQMNKKDLVQQLNQEIERLRMEVHRKSTSPTEKDEQIAQLEALVEHYRGGKQESGDDLAKERKKALEELGLSTDHGELVGVSAQKNVPYLVNLSEDPYLEGCLMYFIRDGVEATLGSAEGNTIVLGGLGIREKHCCFTNKDDVKLGIRPLSWTQSAENSDPRVYLNSKKVVTEMEMFHKDRLTLGMAHAFRVVIPKASSRKSRSDSVQSVEDCMPAVAVLDAVQKQWVQDVLDHAGEAKADLFAKDLQEALSLVGEANQITREIQPHQGLKFGLDVLNQTPSSQSGIPSIVVCTSQVMSENSPTGRRNSLLGRKQDNFSLKFVWEMLKFKSRLNSMRDLYEEMKETSLDDVRERLAMEPYNDPWKEIGAAEVEMLIEGMEIKPSDYSRKTSMASEHSDFDDDEGVKSMFSLGQRKSLAMAQNQEQSLHDKLEELRKKHEEKENSGHRSSSDDSDSDEDSDETEDNEDDKAGGTGSGRHVAFERPENDKKAKALQKENQELRDEMARLKANPKYAASQELETLRAQLRHYEAREAQHMVQMQKMQGWEQSLKKKEAQLQQIEVIASRLRTLEKQHLAQKVEAFRHMLAKKANAPADF